MGPREKTLAEPVALLRVLIIDDDPRVLRALSRGLAGRYAVETAARAEDALERLRADADYAAIVCDLSMPGMDGFEFLERLPEVARGLEDRVVVMTGGTREKEKLERVREKGTPLLGKPFSPDELCALLARLTSA